jgi:putative oxidoreductase
MKPVRSAANAMLASIFVISGVKILLDPDSRADTAKRVTDKVGPWIEKVDPRLPSDTRSLIRLKAGVDVAAGLLLASGRFTRPAALALAVNLVPTTLAGHPFWAMDKSVRTMQQTQFLKNLGLLGGLLLAAVDTQGKPGLGYRAGHAVDRSQKTVKRAVRTARREAKIAALARKLPS